CEFNKENNIIVTLGKIKKYTLSASDLYKYQKFTIMLEDYVLEFDITELESDGLYVTTDDDLNLKLNKEHIVIPWHTNDKKVHPMGRNELILLSMKSYDNKTGYRTALRQFAANILDLFTSIQLLNDNKNKIHAFLVFEIKNGES